MGLILSSRDKKTPIMNTVFSKLNQFYCFLEKFYEIIIIIYFSIHLLYFTMLKKIGFPFLNHPFDLFYRIHFSIDYQLLDTLNP